MARPAFQVLINGLPYGYSTIGYARQEVGLVAPYYGASLGRWLDNKATDVTIDEVVYPVRLVPVNRFRELNIDVRKWNEEIKGRAPVPWLKEAVQFDMVDIPRMGETEYFIRITRNVSYASAGEHLIIVAGSGALAYATEHIDEYRRSRHANIIYIPREGLILGVPSSAGSASPSPGTSPVPSPRGSIVPVNPNLTANPTTHPRLDPGRIILYQRRRLLVTTRETANAATATDEYGNGYNLICTPLGWAVLPLEAILPVITGAEDMLVPAMSSGLADEITALENQVGQRSVTDTLQRLDRLETDTIRLRSTVGRPHYNMPVPRSRREETLMGDLDNTLKRIAALREFIAERGENGTRGVDYQVALQQKAGGQFQQALAGTMGGEQAVQRSLVGPPTASAVETGLQTFRALQDEQQRLLAEIRNARS
jgi:hypothetical protein